MPPPAVTYGDTDCACRNLGDVNTNHHAVSLRVKSLLDSCNEGLDEHCNSGQCSTYVDELGENEVDSAMQVSSRGRFDVVSMQAITRPAKCKSEHVHKVCKAYSASLHARTA